METTHQFKYVVFLNGVLIHFRSKTVDRSHHDTMTRVHDHRFSRGIKMIVVTKRVPAPPAMTAEDYYSARLGIAVDEAIADGSASKLFAKYGVLKHGS